jgi:hypothetical protein
MMRNQIHQPLRTTNTPQEPGTIERVKASADQFGRVPNVMQQRRANQ